MVTWANWHYRDFVGNWVYHLKKTGCSAFVVGAMDDKLLAWLQENGIPTFLMSSGLPTSDFGWGSKSFFKMVSCCLLGWCGIARDLRAAGRHAVGCQAFRSGMGPEGCACGR